MRLIYCLNMSKIHNTFMSDGDNKNDDDDGWVGRLGKKSVKL